MMREHTGDGLLQCLVGDELALLRGDAVDGDGAAVLADSPHEFQIVERLEEVLVVDLDGAILQPLVGNPGILVIILHLVGMGIEPAVRGDDAVAVEVVVAGSIAAVVATISEDLLTRNGTLVAQTLIDEIPDIAALILRVLAHEIPVLLEAADGVTHSVGVLTLDQRTGIVAQGIFLAVLIAHIHRAGDIREAAVEGRTLVVDRTRGIVGLHPTVCFLEVRSEASLIAQTPDDDAGMVLIGDDVTLLALNVHLFEKRVLGQGAFAIAHTMALEV